MISKRHIAALIITVMPWLAWLGGVAAAQDSERGPMGFIRLLNAVSIGAGKLDVLIDGKSLRSEGYQLGNVTGGIALKPKSYKVMFRRDGVTEGQTQVIVVADETLILIPFAEEVPASDRVAAHWEIRILRLKQHAANGRRTVSFVSVSREPDLNMEIRQSNGTWESIRVQRLGIARADIRQARGYLRVRCQDRELPAVSVAASGNFVAVLHEDEHGLLRSTNFQDYKYLSTQ